MSNRIVAGPSAMLHRSTGLSRRRIRVYGYFTAVLREEINHPHQSNACLDLNQRFGSVLFAICPGFDPNQQKDDAYCLIIYKTFVLAQFSRAEFERN